MWRNLAARKDGGDVALGCSLRASASLRETAVAVHPPPRRSPRPPRSPVIRVAHDGDAVDDHVHDADGGLHRVQHVTRERSSGLGPVIVFNFLA